MSASPPVIDVYTTSILSNLGIRGRHERVERYLTHYPHTNWDVVSNDEAMIVWKQVRNGILELPCVCVNGARVGSIEQMDEAVEYNELRQFLGIPDVPLPTSTLPPQPPPPTVIAAASSLPTDTQPSASDQLLLEDLSSDDIELLSAELDSTPPSSTIIHSNIASSNSIFLEADAVKRAFAPIPTLPLSGRERGESEIVTVIRPGGNRPFVREVKPADDDLDDLNVDEDELDKLLRELEGELLNSSDAHEEEDNSVESVIVEEDSIDSTVVVENRVEESVSVIVIDREDSFSSSTVDSIASGASFDTAMTTMSGTEDDDTVVLEAMSEIKLEEKEETEEAVQVVEAEVGVDLPSEERIPDAIEQKMEGDIGDEGNEVQKQTEVEPTSDSISTLSLPPSSLRHSVSILPATASLDLVEIVALLATIIPVAAATHPEEEDIKPIESNVELLSTAVESDPVSPTTASDQQPAPVLDSDLPVLVAPDSVIVEAEKVVAEMEPEVDVEEETKREDCHDGGEDVVKIV